MKLFRFAVLVFLMGVPSWAWMGDLEPIIGYERVQKWVPSPHTKDRLIYGARYNLGLGFLGAEAEYTRASDTESFPSSGLETQDTSDRLKLGARLRFFSLGIVSASARLGGEAYRNVHQETVSGITTTTTEPIRYRPYAGALLNGHLGRSLGVHAGLTAVFRDFPDMSQNDYQVTAGFSVKFP